MAAGWLGGTGGAAANNEAAAPVAAE